MSALTAFLPCGCHGCAATSMDVPGGLLSLWPFGRTPKLERLLDAAHSPQSQWRWSWIFYPRYIGSQQINELHFTVRVPGIQQNWLDFKAFEATRWLAKSRGIGVFNSLKSQELEEQPLVHPNQTLLPASMKSWYVISMTTKLFRFEICWKF